MGIEEIPPPVVFQVPDRACLYCGLDAPRTLGRCSGCGAPLPSLRARKLGSDEVKRLEEEWRRLHTGFPTNRTVPDVERLLVVIPVALAIAFGAFIAWAWFL